MKKRGKCGMFKDSAHYGGQMYDHWDEAIRTLYAYWAYLSR